jgi:hypothetical protein
VVKTELLEVIHRLFAADEGDTPATERGIYVASTYQALWQAATSREKAEREQMP